MTADRQKAAAVTSGADQLRALNTILQESQSVVFFFGDTASTESGIPDFRSKDGLYRRKNKKFGKYQPEYLLSARCLKKEPEIFFAYCRQHLDTRPPFPSSGTQTA